MFRSAGPVILPFWLLVGTGLCAQNPSASPRSGEALHIAVHLGDFERVKQLIASGADVNARDALGSTPLHDAAWSGNAEIVRFLIANDANPNATTDERRSTPLEFAVLGDHAEIVKLLLAGGARLDMRYNDGQTILHLAAARGDAQILDVLIGSQASVKATDARDETPLDVAVLYGQLAAVQLLIARGADVRRVRSEDGRGALHEACIKGFARLIEPLVDAGANPGQPDRFGETPVDVALAFKNGKAVAALLHLQHGEKEAEAAAKQAMENATVKGRTEIAQMLIDHGFDINKPNPMGSTYLHDAALKGQTKMLQLLLDRGARIDALDQNGATPLHDAALGGNADAVGFLLDRGARIDARDRESGATPLMFAADLGRANTVALLLKRGADPVLRDYAGRTALDHAKRSEQNEIIQLLETALAGAKASRAG